MPQASPTKPSSSKRAAPPPQRAPLNLLCAFPYFSSKVFELLRNLPHERYRLIVDSGAFTAHNAGKPVDLDAYCAFLDKLEPLRPFDAVQLDVIGDPEGTWRNLELMQSRGYDVMPVFQRGDEAESLERMYGVADYVNVGGVVGGSENRNFMKWVAELGRGRKQHWLGFIEMDLIKAYKPTSVDSSSWNMAARRGQSNLYIGGGHLETLSRERLAKGKPSALMYARAQQSGLSAREFTELQFDRCWRTKTFNTFGSVEEPANLALRLSVCSHVRRALDVEKHVGTRVYLSFPAAAQVQYLLWCYNDLERKGLLP
jgi:hypothetical protein